MADDQRLMVVMAHCDDAEIWAGGTICAHTAAGFPALIVVLSGNAADPRGQEARAGSQAMGAHLAFIGGRDRFLETTPDLVERIKVNSHNLRGQIIEELATDSSRFTEDQVQLIKFHGMYQQEDRDARQERKAAGVEKAYQFMIRSRIPGGALTAAQYLVEDRLAGQYGNDTLRITTRQGFQLHGILKGDIRPTIAAINAALLSTLAACGDVNRNVMACPAPAGNRAHAQIQEIAHKIAMHMAPRSRAYHDIWLNGEQVHTVETPQEPEEEPIYGPTYLPRKFKIGVAYPGDNCIDIYTQDVGLIAHLEGETLQGFTVIIGGGMGSTHGKTETYPRLASPFCYITPDKVLPVVETIVKIQRDYGDRANRKHARLKYVVEERGVEWFRAEAASRLGYELAEPRPVEWQDVDDHLGWHKQADGCWYLGLHVENGRIKDTESLKLRTGLRAVMERFQPNVRLTGQQNILLTDIPAEQRQPLETLLQEHGIVTDPTHVGLSRHALACPALPTCGLALANAERALPEVVAEIQQDLIELGLPNERLSIRMTGCPNGCARPALGDIGFVGRTKDVYTISVGGDWTGTRMNEQFADSIHVSKLAETVRPLLELWKEDRFVGETFGDYCYRIGIQNLATRIAERATADNLVAV